MQNEVAEIKKRNDELHIPDEVLDEDWYVLNNICLTKGAVTSILPISQSALAKLIKKGILPKAMLVGGRRFYTASQVREAKRCLLSYGDLVQETHPLR